MFPSAGEAMKRKRHEDVPANLNWRVIHQQRTILRNSLESGAIDAGVTVARANMPSQLVLYRADGTIEDERTYCDDPYPPKGWLIQALVRRGPRSSVVHAGPSLAKSQ